MTEQASSITVLLQYKEISLYRESSMIVLWLFYSTAKPRESFVFFLFWLLSPNFFRLHHWHCPRITSFVSLRGIKAGNPVRERGTHLSNSGNQSEHFAKKNIISFSRGRFIKKNSSLSCSFHLLRISHLPGISYADVSENWLPFERLSRNNYGGTDS